MAHEKDTTIFREKAMLQCFANRKRYNTAVWELVDQLFEMEKVEAILKHYKAFESALVTFDEQDAADLIAITSKFNVTNEDVKKVYTCMVTNNLAFTINGKIGNGFFPILSYMNHSCNPNAAITYECEEGKVFIRLVASTHISPQEEITITYLDHQLLGFGREARGHALKMFYGFQCNCKRCELEK